MAQREPEPATSAQHDWPAEISTKIEGLVDGIRNKTTVPAIRLARAVVFGLVVAVMAVVALVLLTIALVRLIDVYLPLHPEARRVWVAYLGLGAIFLLVGAFLWSKRVTRKHEE